MRGARQAPAGTGLELVKAGPGALDKGTREEASSGQVAMAEPVKKTWRGSGLKRLQKAADQRLGSASKELANLLLKKAQEGKVESTRMLVGLAEHWNERKPEEKKKKKKGVQPWIELMASEPEWVEEKPEIGDVWIGDGWKKESGRIVKEDGLAEWSLWRPKVGDVWNGDGWKNPETGKVTRTWYEITC